MLGVKSSSLTPNFKKGSRGNLVVLFTLVEQPRTLLYEKRTLVKNSSLKYNKHTHHIPDWNLSLLSELVRENGLTRIFLKSVVPTLSRQRGWHFQWPTVMMVESSEVDRFLRETSSALDIFRKDSQKLTFTNESCWLKVGTICWLAGSQE